MKKIKFICLIFIVILLSGCTFDETMSVMMDEVLQKASNTEIATTKSHVKQYYSYYIQPSIGRRESTEISNVFVLNDDEFVMNLNVSSVIKNEYYLDADTKILPVYSRSKKLVYESTGQCLNSSENMMDYSVSVYDLSRNSYLIVLESNYFTFLSRCPLGSIVQLTEQMLLIARTTEIEVDSILRDFGVQNDETYEKQKVEIIKEMIPESGLVEDIIPGSSKDDPQTEESSEEEIQIPISEVTQISEITESEIE